MTNKTNRYRSFSLYNKYGEKEGGIKVIHEAGIIQLWGESNPREYPISEYPKVLRILKTFYEFCLRNAGDDAEKATLIADNRDIINRRLADLDEQEA